MIEVIIIDNDCLSRFGIRCLIEQSTLKVCGECTYSEGLEVIKQTNPELVVMGLNSGAEIILIDQIKKESNSKVIIFANSTDENLYFSAIQAGSDGYLIKSANSIESIKLAINAVLTGCTFYDSLFSKMLLSRMNHGKGRKFDDPPSKKEYEILHLIANGLTNEEIAQQLYISINTVKKHANNLQSKLGAKNRPHIVERAYKLGHLAVSYVS